MSDNNEKYYAINLGGWGSGSTQKQAITNCKKNSRVKGYGLWDASEIDSDAPTWISPIYGPYNYEKDGKKELHGPAIVKQAKMIAVINSKGEIVQSQKWESDEN